jgi:hypothetical protein
MDDRLPEDVMLDEALRTAPRIRVPVNFRQRLLTRLPDPPAPPRRRRWFWPAIGIFGLLSFVYLADAAWQIGLANRLTQPSMLLATLGIEIVFSVVLLWRARA